MVQITVLGNAKQNPIPMNLPLQLLTLCPWTVHPPKGGAGLFAMAHGAWGLGAVTPRSWTVVFGAVDVQRDQSFRALFLQMRPSTKLQSRLEKNVCSSHQTFRAMACISSTLISPVLFIQ